MPRAMADGKDFDRSMGPWLADCGSLATQKDDERLEHCSHACNGDMDVLAAWHMLGLPFVRHRDWLLDLHVGAIKSEDEDRGNWSLRDVRGLNC